jgi:hypothetical protein
MNAVVFQDLADHRADVLDDNNLNGMKLALVALPAGPNPDHADLDLRFYNGLHLTAILAEIAATPARAGQIFRVRGGARVLAGPATGQVKVTGASSIDAERLALRVEPVGDYSTYTLELVWDAARVDPFFSTLGFKFRPGCFTNDCSPRLEGRPLEPGPAINYLAKDYETFRHVLMVAMAERVPGWKSTSEADHDQVLIDLFAAAADELSDYQDRVMNEAYLASARTRVTLARHGRLVDYHLHEGNQASTWLALEVVAGQAPFTLADQEIITWTGAASPLPESIFFATREHRLPLTQAQRFDPLVNRLRLHTWSGAWPALRAGSASADVVPDVPAAGQLEADTLRDLVIDGLLRQILIIERLNPLTGKVPGRNPRKRQLLRLLSGPNAAESIRDPVTNTWLVRLHWRDEDQLRFDYSFTTFCGGMAVTDVSAFHGNLVPVHEGRPMRVLFQEPGTILAADTATEKYRYFERLNRHGDGLDWVLAALPEGPLAYLPTPANGEIPPLSTLHVQVTLPSGTSPTWDEVESLVYSDDTAAQGDHFMVETDERQRSVLRFGNGVNGRLLPSASVVQADYQIGGGHLGNIGAEQLLYAQPLTGALTGAIVSVWNPFDVTDGRNPELPEKIRRNAPEAYRARQLRAVTLADYVRRAEEVSGVSGAVARYAWTGSWRTVRVVIDPVGTVTLDDALRRDVAAHLESVRLIGEDLELRPPHYVPLDLRINICGGETYWRETLRFELEQEFSDGYTSDGRRGFFHPDEWTFGQAIHRSKIEGRILRVTGVKHVIGITMKRFNDARPSVPGLEILPIGFDEVVLCANDPDHLERGRILFEVQGGRQ